MQNVQFHVLVAKSHDAVVQLSRPRFALVAFQHTPVGLDGRVNLQLLSHVLGLAVVADTKRVRCTTPRDGMFRAVLQPSLTALQHIFGRKMSSSEEGHDSDGEGVHTLTNEQRKHSSIVTGPLTLDTIAGPIHEWAAVPENLPKHPTMAFFGKRRTGKSTTITNVLYHCCQDIPFGLVMSDTAYAGYWEKIVPKAHIIQGLRADVLNWLIDRQAAAVEKYGVKDPRIAAFIILDDVIADQKTIRYNADISRFFVQG